MTAKQGCYTLIATVGFLLVEFFYPFVDNCAASDLTGGSFTNTQAAPATTNIVNEVSSLYKTIVDKDSGQYAVVDSTKAIVTLRDKTDRVLWSANIAEGLKVNPLLNGRKIQGMQVQDDGLWVSVGRGYAIIDVKTGKLKGIYCR